MKNKLQTLILITACLNMTACFESGSTPEVATASKATTMSALAVTAPTFTIPTDIPTDPIDCSFNGSVVVDGTSVSAFQNSTAEFGNSCISENRTCTAGILSGSYQFANCSVGVAASCLFNGATINHGDSITGYTSSTVGFGQVCSSVAETRTCSNGVLSGSATFASCDTNAARSCLFDGKTILSGDSIPGFQSSSSQFGGACVHETRICTDGTLSGSFAFGSCTIDQPASCLLNGRTLAHGETAVAFQSSSAFFGKSCNQENRTCDNGALSGTYDFDSCVVDSPISCSLNGSTVTHGTSVVAFESATVGFGQTCVSEARSCSNGTLSGSYTNTSCETQSPNNCTLNGNTVAHGTSVTTYASATVPVGQICQPETRTCSNGILSGTSVSESCQVDVVVISPPATCTFNEKSYPSDIIIKAYQSATVAYGQTCVSESRECLNGSFTGSFTNASCTVDGAANCQLNGKTISHGSSVTVFKSASVASGQVCQTEMRSCTNGILSGSAVSETCVVQNPPPPPPPPPSGDSCQPSNIIWEFPKECRGNCGKGNGYFKSRISRDGGQKWLVIMKNKLPDDLKEIWNYMIKQNGKNSCDRPNVNYTISKNAGYVVLDIKKIPNCKVCRFIEVEQERENHHGMCNKKKEKKKVLKFICGEIKKKKHHGHDKHDNDDDGEDEDHHGNSHGEDDDHGHEHEDRD